MTGCVRLPMPYKCTAARQRSGGRAHIRAAAAAALTSLLALDTDPNFIPQIRAAPAFNLSLRSTAPISPSPIKPPPAVTSRFPFSSAAHAPICPPPNHVAAPRWQHALCYYTLDGVCALERCRTQLTLNGGRAAGCCRWWREGVWRMAQGHEPASIDQCMKVEVTLLENMAPGNEAAAHRGELSTSPQPGLQQARRARMNAGATAPPAAMPSSCHRAARSL